MQDWLDRFSPHAGPSSSKDALESHPFGKALLDGGLTFPTTPGVESFTPNARSRANSFTSSSSGGPSSAFSSSGDDADGATTGADSSPSSSRASITGDDEACSAAAAIVSYAPRAIPALATSATHQPKRSSQRTGDCVGEDDDDVAAPVASTSANPAAATTASTSASASASQSTSASASASACASEAPSTIASPRVGSVGTAATSLSIHSTEPSPERGAKLASSASLAHARSVLEHQAASLLSAARRMREEELTYSQFEGAQELICKTLKAGGKLVFTGVGKSGIIASKLSCTSLSLGLPSTTIDPTNALHGDLGLLNGCPEHVARNGARFNVGNSLIPSPPCDLLIALSHSGSSSELLSLMKHVTVRGVKVIALTAKKDSALGDAAVASGGFWIDCRTAARGDVNMTEHDLSAHCNDFSSVAASTKPSRIPMYGLDEADASVPAPSSSTTTALAMGDSLILSSARMLGIGTPEHFAWNHPGGALGKRLLGETGLPA